MGCGVRSWEMRPEISDLLKDLPWDYFKVDGRQFFHKLYDDIIVSNRLIVG